MNKDIVFYQQYAVPYFSILSLSAHLKHAGISAGVVIESLEDNPLETLKKLNPKLIGISVLSPEHNWLIKTSQKIKSILPDTKIIVGGIHAIFYPEEILESASVDLVCHGDGESTLLSVMNEIDKQSPNFASIAGIAYKDSKNKICMNERASLVPFNDEIIEDRAIYYDKYPQLAKDAVHRFFCSRGCPYKCSFCYNSNIHDIFKGKGTYIRQKSVENFIAELYLQTSKYPIKFIYFYDDLFTFNKKWLKSFLSIYKDKVGVPFMCNTRANVIDEEVASMLKDAGCRTAGFGVETGNERIRKDILKKEITDEQLIRCGLLLKKYGIKTQTTNMFCLPQETLSDAYETIELNIKAKTDYAFSALFLPFPKTEIADYCIKEGFIKTDYSLKDLPCSFLSNSILSLKDKNSIVNVHKLAFFFIKWPWFYKVFKGWVRLYFLNPVFSIIFIISNFVRHKEERGISFITALKFAWRLRKSF
jgi:radical SAM superfamily enzyme YgiQ (UPF0313 family)